MLVKGIVEDHRWPRMRRTTWPSHYIDIKYSSSHITCIILSQVGAMDRYEFEMDAAGLSESEDYGGGESDYSVESEAWMDQVDDC